MSRCHSLFRYVKIIRFSVLVILTFAPLMAQADHVPATAQEAQIATEAYAMANHKMHADMGAESTGDTDADFVIGMRAHHNGAVAMAEILLAHGTDPTTRDLAQTIKNAQTDEIAWMTEWLVSHGYE